jgi:wyosine [tRNA(Phe)-imidazoG37] synthetase (radical SAM superfamily)
MKKLLLKILQLPIFGKKVCPLPFSKIEISAKGDYIPCCHDWLTTDYYSISNESQSDLWNSNQAKKMRESIYQQDYKYCKRDICQTTLLSPLIILLLDKLGLISKIFPQTSFNTNNTIASLEKKVQMPSPPSMAVIQGDFRCNLACPSCRSDFITKLSPSEEERLDNATKLLKDYSRGLEKIQLAGDGEALYSPWHRDQFKSFNKESFPNLKEVILYTNGLLFNEKSYNELMPGMSLVNNVIVSIDAGDEETYEKVRGKGFEKLLQNLFWMKSLRKSKVLKLFRICFVVRLENLDSIKKFVELGHNLEVDQIIFRPLQKWDNMGISQYEEQAIHLSSHPSHQDFLKIKNEVKNLSKVVFEA